MAAPIYRITFPKVKSPQQPDGYFHRMANFGEDLYRDVQMPGLCELKTDIDSYFTEIVMQLAKKRHNAEVRDIVESQLKHHNFAGEAVVSRENATYNQPLQL